MWQLIFEEEKVELPRWKPGKALCALFPIFELGDDSLPKRPEVPNETPDEWLTSAAKNKLRNFIENVAVSTDTASGEKKQTDPAKVRTLAARTEKILKKVVTEYANEGVGTENVALSDQLKPVKLFLKDCVSPLLNYAPPESFTDEVLKAYGACYYAPSVAVIRSHAKKMASTAHERAETFRSEIEGLSKSDRKIYEASFEKSLDASGKVQYENMLSELDALARGLGISSDSRSNQPSTDAVELTVKIRSKTARFRELIDEVTTPVVRTFPDVVKVCLAYQYRCGSSHTALFVC